MRVFAKGTAPPPSGKLSPFNRAANRENAITQTTRKINQHQPAAQENKVTIICEMRYCAPRRD